jgi:dTDP-L-rhamnose 4-epimerase
VAPPGYLNPAAEYVWGDLAETETARRAVRGVEAVSHQAARVGLGVDFGDVADYVRDNDVGTATLLRALHQRRWSGRFVLGSSMVVYGEGRYVCPEDGMVGPAPRRPIDLEAGRFEPPCPLCGRTLDPTDVGEETPPDPRNVYAATKLHQEHLCDAFARETGSAMCALRYHNVYGPRMPRDTPYAGVASIFRSAYARGEAPIVYEDGQQRRDFVHVADVARANVAALVADDTVTGPFNIASGEVRTVAEMAVALRAGFVESGVSEPVVSGAYRIGDVRHITASPHRARRLLGFDPVVSFASGMRAFAAVELRQSAASL